VIASYLGRGLAAGLLAGLLSGLFAFFVGEPLLSQAIALEAKAEAAHAEKAAHAHGSTAHQHEESGMVHLSRGTQKVGLFFATGLSGSFVGGLFGMVFAFFRGRLRAKSDWSRSLSLAAALFAGVALLPFLKYPSNPPGVGAPSTIGSRTTDYFAIVALSLLAVLVAWYVAKLLRERGVSAPVRQVGVGVGFAAVVGVLLAGLPPATDPGRFPAGLLWNFRMASLGTLLTLWAVLGASFGALCERANRKGPGKSDQKRN
jgi:predicted cobalt transporter CbtA